MDEKRRYSSESDDITNYYLEAARNNIHGVSTIHKFGFSESISTADLTVDIWDGVAEDIGGKVTTFNWILSPIGLQVSSNSALDTAVKITIEGLDADGIEQLVEVTLTGTTAVVLEGTWSAVNRMWNSGSIDLKGYIFCSDAGAALSTGRPTNQLLIRAVVHLKFQQTQQAVYTVPSNKSLYILHGWAHISKEITTEAIINIYRARPGGVFRVLHTLSLQTSGSSGDQRPYIVPIKIQPGTRLTYRAQVFSNGTSVSAGFHGLLIEE